MYDPHRVCVSSRCLFIFLCVVFFLKFVGCVLPLFLNQLSILIDILYYHSLILC